METMLKTEAVLVKQLVQVNPDWLIELGHRMKAAAMDQAFPGDSVRAEFTPDIDVIFTPDRDYQKPQFSLIENGTTTTASQ